MTGMTRIFTGGAGLAVIAAAPAAAQYYNTNVKMAADRCVAAVQSRLNAQSGSAGRVLSVTRTAERSRTVWVKGLATSGAFGPSGVGAYGALGYSYAPPADISFTCNVDYRGFVKHVELDRRYRR